MATRKNVIALSAAEKSAIINAVLQLSAAGGYGKYVAWHSQAMDLMSAHMGPAFCPWHRQFILLFERDLQNAAGSILSRTRCSTARSMSRKRNRVRSRVPNRLLTIGNRQPLTWA